MLLLSLGVVSRERFSCLELVKEYIRQKQLFEVSNIYSKNTKISDTQKVVVIILKFEKKHDFTIQ